MIAQLYGGTDLWFRKRHHDMLYHSVVLQTRGERKTIEEAYPCEDDLG